MNRYTLLFAYAWYAQLWGPTRYAARLHRLGVRLGPCARLERENFDVKEAYGRIVRREHRLYVGFERLYRRHPQIAGSWPGTSNMPRGDIGAWLRSRGLYDAVDALCPWSEP